MAPGPSGRVAILPPRFYAVWAREKGSEPGSPKDPMRIHPGLLIRLGIAGLVSNRGPDSGREATQECSY